MNSNPPLENDYQGLIDKLFPSAVFPRKGYPSRLYIDEIIRIASCLSEGTILERIDTATKLIETTPISFVETLIGSPETFTFDVVNGRSGTIASATIGGAINALTTYDVQYLLVAGGDWKRYTGGLFTGVEVDQQIDYVGVQNRVIYTPTGGADTTIMVAI